MNVSTKDAISALQDIDKAADRTRELNSYRIAGPIIMLWGLIWMIGYSGMGLLDSDAWGWLWITLDLVGGLGTFVLLRKIKTTRPANRMRPLIIVVAVAVFIAATLWVFRPAPTNAVLVFPTLLCGLVYGIVGSGGLPRFVWIGGAVTLASLIGYEFFTPWLTFWIAGVGGLSLVLGGYWMRQV